MNKMNKTNNTNTNKTKTPPKSPVIPRTVLENYIRRFIEEDAFYGDCTIVPGKKIEAEVVAKEDFVLSGAEVAKLAFELCGCRAEALEDGVPVKKGETILTVEGPAKDVLLVERTALNLIQRMSGIATATRKLVDIVEPYGVTVAATRKTTPGFRIFEKLAVAHGGGDTHRMSLSDCVLVKDNHIAVAGSVERAVEVAKSASFTKKIEVEVSSVEDAVKAALAGADIVMLDNMDVRDVEEAVRKLREIRESIVVEASGGINPDNAESYARTGVDVISSGWITHSARAVDVSMRVVRVW